MEENGLTADKNVGHVPRFELARDPRNKAVELRTLAGGHSTHARGRCQPRDRPANRRRNPG